MKNGPAKPVRCAIYTRVSTDHGLEQDFNSLDAQYDASQAYIRSQVHAGWTLIRSRYDDGVEILRSMYESVAVGDCHPSLKLPPASVVRSPPSA